MKLAIIMENGLLSNVVSWLSSSYVAKWPYCNR